MEVLKSARMFYLIERKSEKKKVKRKKKKVKSRRLHCLARHRGVAHLTTEIPTRTLQQHNR
jgi:predicted protein tyrosine phosphatase